MNQDADTKRYEISRYALVEINGPHPGNVIELNSRYETISMGRDEAREIPIDDPLVSRLHAKLEHSLSHWAIEDCQSSNGTWVNSTRIQRVTLDGGDLIRMGDRMFMFVDCGTIRSRDRLRLSPTLLGATSLYQGGSGVRSTGSFVVDATRDRSDSIGADHFPTILRFARQVWVVGSWQRASELTIEATLRSVAADIVHIWLTATDGRLRCVATNAPEGTHSAENALAALARERNEAISVVAPIDGPDASCHLVAPIPGHERPRGVIEAIRTSPGRLFTPADGDVVLTLAHHVGIAAELFEHREQLEQANENLRRRLGPTRRIVGDSPTMAGLTEQIARVARTTSAVLILGEPGVGKGLVAQTIHDLSPRAAGPFVTVHCAAFDERLLESELFGHEVGAFTGADQRRLGQIERAHQGTIYLDEVGSLTANGQAKLLRVLAGESFDRVGGSEPIHAGVRVISASSVDLANLVRQGRFREDLYLRLGANELQVSSLRARGEDTLLLAKHFLHEFRHKLGRGPRQFASSAIEAILNHHWPGNVRELRNAVERAVILGIGDEIEPTDLSLPIFRLPNHTDWQMSLADAERRHIERVLAACGGNKTQACKILGIGRGTLYNRLKLPMEADVSDH